MNEEIKQIVESVMKIAEDEKKFANCSDSVKEVTSIVVENQIQSFLESTKIPATDLKNYFMNEAAVPNIAYADIAKFGEIYLPIATKVIPSLVINNMVGVQPMGQPNGFVYAMRASYSRGPYDQTTSARGAKFGNTQILNLSTVTGATANTTWVVTAVANNLIARGFVLYIEGTLALVKVLSGDAGNGNTYRNFAAGDVVDYVAASTDAYAVADANVSAIYKNELAQAAGIFKGYSGPVVTDDGMYQENVGQVSITVQRETVEAKTRQLFAEYPIEAEQDLRNIHKRDLRAELAEITAGEIVNELNKEFIDDINTAAAVGGTTTFDMETADGRWEIEKFRNLYTRITKSANDIAMATRLGPGNYIIASPNVITALTQLDGFMAAPVQTGTFGNVSRIGGEWFVGTIGGMYSIYRDMFATSDYVTVGRKGANEWDAGLFFLPYIPLQFIAGQTQENLQPKMKFMTRYGKIHNVLKDSNTVADARYYRYINVNNLF